MNPYLNYILLSTCAIGLVSCGGSSSSSKTTPAPTYTQVSNVTVPNGITKVTTIEYASENGPVVIQVDPSDNSFVATTPDGKTFDGTYVPETGGLVVNSNNNTIFLPDFNMNKLNYTALSEESSFGFGGGIGVERTDAANLPSNVQVYNGAFASDVGNGDATTTIDFDAENVDVRLSGTTGEALGGTIVIDNLDLVGSGFGAGDDTTITLVARNGFTTNDYDYSNASGALYGPNGEEVLGQMSLYDDGNDIDITGTWNGSR